MVNTTNTPAWSSMVLPGSFFTPGKSIRIFAAGTILSAANTPVFTVTVRFDDTPNVTIAAPYSVALTSGTAYQWRLFCTITARSPVPNPTTLAVDAHLVVKTVGGSYIAVADVVGTATIVNGSQYTINVLKTCPSARTITCEVLTVEVLA
jgi:hypothetical protein